MTPPSPSSAAFARYGWSFLANNNNNNNNNRRILTRQTVRRQVSSAAAVAFVTQPQSQTKRTKQQQQQRLFTQQTPRLYPPNSFLKQQRQRLYQPTTTPQRCGGGVQFMSVSTSTETTTISNETSYSEPTNNPDDILFQQQQQFAYSDDMDDDEDDTIFALSSGGIGSGGGSSQQQQQQPTAVAVIRMTGPASGRILLQLTRRIKLPKPRLATLCKLYEPTTIKQSSSTNEEEAPPTPLDQALVLWFPGPKSFTGEDVVEFHCHGSRAVIQDVLRALQDCGETESSTSDDDGEDQTDTLTTTTTSTKRRNRKSSFVRLAEPGEFTQRAFQAGKLDLLQVEALADLIASDTSVQRTLALRQLDDSDYGISKVYQRWRSELIGGLAHAEAVIDFGDDERLGDEDDDEHNDSIENTAQWSIWGNVVDRMRELRTDMERQLRDVRGELVRDGLKVCLIGPPNAGKSSLFNLLADRQAAIVSSTAGTTRDVLEISLNLAGCKCILQDTAGMRAITTRLPNTTSDDIEVEGMRRAAAAASNADLIIALLDAGAPTTPTTTEQSTTTSFGGGGWQSEWEQLQSILTENQINLNRVMLVLNKADLRDSNSSSSGTTTTTIPQENTTTAAFGISCKTQQGIDLFLTNLTKMVTAQVSGTGMQEDDDDDGAQSSSTTTSSTPATLSLITRARHRQHVQGAVEALTRFESLSQQGPLAVDLAAEELRLASSELGRILGAVDVEDVLDKLFSDFCIGK